MTDVLFTYGYDIDEIKRISELGYHVITKNENEIIYNDKFKDVEILICYSPFKTLDIGKMKNLKWIQLSSVGFDMIPVNTVIDNKITVTNNKGGYSIPIAEWIVMSILELMRKSKYFYNNQEKKVWKWQLDLVELYHKKICFIGTGSIAREAAIRLKSFETEIIGFNTTGKCAEYFDRCYSIKNIKSYISDYDVVVLAVPGTEDTTHIINADIISCMKEGVFFVNISRGSIVSEKALISALECGKIKGAALDVFENEPLEQDNPLWNMQNVIVTPHNSWVSELKDKRRYEIIFENLKRYKNQEKLMNIVDVKRGY